MEPLFITFTVTTFELPFDAWDTMQMTVRIPAKSLEAAGLMQI